MSRPAGRYDEPRRPPGRRARLLGAVAAAVAVAVVLLVARWLTSGTVPFQVTAYQVLSDHAVEVRADVRPGGRAAQCQVRARDRFGAVVGTAVVPVPATSGTAHLAYRLATSARAATGEVTACRPA